MNHQFKDITGQVFGKLAVTGYHGRNKYGQALWACQCACGQVCVSLGTALRNGEKQSCGCRIHRVLPDNGATFNELYARYRHYEKQRGVSFELTKDEFMSLVSTECHYCGREPYSEMNSSARRHNGTILYNGIDRVNNNHGYTVTNCVPCCKECNHAKHTLTHDQFINMCRLIAQRHGG